MLAFAVFVTVLTGFMFGVLPALVQSQTNVAMSIGGRGVAGGRRQILRGSLAAAQTSLSMILLVGVGLSLNGFLRAQGNDVGFAPDAVALLEVELPRTQYALSGHMEARRRLWTVLPSVEAAGRGLRERLAAVPGVVAVGLSSLAPPRSCRAAQVEVPQAGDGRLNGRHYDYQTVSPEYFEALGVPLVRGRGFAESDSSGAVIVNEAFARELFGDGSVLGKTVTVLGWRPGLRDVAVIVGVVADSLVSPWQIDGARPQFYLPYSGQPEETPGNMRDRRLTLSYVIRTLAAPSTVFPAAKRAVSAELADLPVERLATLESEFESVLVPARGRIRPSTGNGEPDLSCGGRPIGTLRRHGPRPVGRCQPRRLLPVEESLPAGSHQRLAQRMIPGFWCPGPSPDGERGLVHHLRLPTGTRLLPPIVRSGLAVIFPQPITVHRSRLTGRFAAARGRSAAAIDAAIRSARMRPKDL